MADANHECAGLSATYSPEDNKLRLYASARLPRELFERVKDHGFKWAPKQELFVAPSWTPAREDFLLELCGEIDDESYSVTERAADRAERFEVYRDKRATEAGVKADTFEAGPSAFGHQSRARAERQAARHDRHRTGAVTQWRKAEYWQSRTAGVIANALHRADARTRRGRILTIEKELRGVVDGQEQYAKRFAAWQRVLTLDGISETIPQDKEHRPNLKDAPPACQLAYNLANVGSELAVYPHPRDAAHRHTSLYSLLTDPKDPITAYEAAHAWLDGRRAPYDQESSAARWAAHYEMRLTYERAMLENEGGSAAAADMVPGGWINTGNRTGSAFTKTAVRWKQILKVNKSPATGRVVSVQVMGTFTGYTKESGYTQQATKPCPVNINIERLGEDAYRPPTVEELEAFNQEQKAKKAAAKATAPKAPPLVNPTDEDAQRLQDLWNAKAKAGYDAYKKRCGYDCGEYVPAAVLRITQSHYAAASKGTYAKAETVDVCEDGHSPARWHEGRRAVNPPTAFKVRKTYGPRNGLTGQAYAVIILTDKPQKPLPLNWAAIERGNAPAAVEQPAPVAIVEKSLAEVCAA